MDIRCNKCGTEYSLDDTLITGSGTSVRCMNCNQVFKVYKTSGKGPDEWELRHAHGPLRTIDNLSLLQQWIQEGKISKDDLLSRKNGPWKKIGDIEQFKPFFENARHNPAPSAGQVKSEKSAHQSTIRRKPRQDLGLDVTERFAALKEPSAEPRKAIEAGGRTGAPIRSSAKLVENEKPTLPPPPVALDPPLSATPRASDQWEDEITHTFSKGDMSNAEKIGRETFDERINGGDTKPPPQNDAPDFSAIPVAKEDGAWGTGEKATVTEPAWTEKSGGLPRYEAAMDSMPPSRRGSGKWIVLGAAIVGLSAAAMFLFWPDNKDDLLSTMGDMVGSQDPMRFQKFLDRGQESFLLDTNVSFLQADREFQKVLALKEAHPPTLAALARLYAVWAQYIRDAKLDFSADLPSAKTDDEGENGEIALMSREFDGKLREAVQWGRQATAADPKLKETLLAAADIARLSGDFDEAERQLKQAESAGTDAETEYTATLINVDKGGDPKTAADRLDRAIGDRPMIRAIYRIARIRAAVGQKDAAEAQLAKLFNLNSDHPQAKDLKARIDAKKKILLVDKTVIQNSQSAVDDGAPTDTVDTSSAAASSTLPVETPPAVAETDKAPQGTSSILKRAAALQSSGQPEAAKTLYQSILDREPSNVDALTGVGYCYLDKGETGKALANFRRAINIRPAHGAALIGTAETYKSMGQKEQALKFYRSYLLVNASGAQADMARKNVARFEAELEGGAAEAQKKSSRDDSENDNDNDNNDNEDDNMVIDDSPPVDDPAVEKPSDAPAGSSPKEDVEDAPASDKPTIIIMKKEDPSSSEE